MWFDLLFQKILIFWVTVCAVLLFSFSAGAQVVDADGEPIVIPEPWTITATLPQKAPERVVELYWYSEDGSICVDTYKLTLSRSVIVKNTTVSARMRISRKCDERAKTAPVPVRVVYSTRMGQKPGASETIEPGSASFAFDVTFPSAGNWVVSVVSHYNGNETHTVTVPVHVLAEPPVVQESPADGEAP